MKQHDLAELDLHTITVCKNYALLGIADVSQWPIEHQRARLGVINKLNNLAIAVKEAKDGKPVGAYPRTKLVVQHNHKAKRYYNLGTHQLVDDD